MFTVQSIKKHGLNYYGVFYSGTLVETHMSQAMAVTKALQLQAKMKQANNVAG